MPLVHGVGVFLFFNGKVDDLLKIIHCHSPMLSYRSGVEHPPKDSLALAMNYHYG
jgi:hypothetical protein